MPKIRKTELLPHAVICDTNVLWHDDKAPVASPDFEKFWAKASEEFDLTLCLPEIVKGELLFQHYTSCTKLLRSTEDSLKKISGIAHAHHSVRLTLEKLKSQIEAKFAQWLEEKSASLLPLPVDRIDWGRVANDAVWRVPPFALDPKYPDNEKGFRDALILETVCHFAQNDAKAGNIAFVCNDAILRNAASTRLGQDGRFATYEDLKGFESYLRLTKEKLTKEFIAKILSRAAERFFSSSDATCLYLRENLESRLAVEFKEHMDDPMKSAKRELQGLGFFEPPTKWVRVGNGAFWIRPPEFVRIEGDKFYFWKSVVRYVQAFAGERDNSGFSNLLGGAVSERVLFLPFHVTWSARVKNDARFHDLEVKEIHLVENEFRAATDDEKRRFRLAKADGNQ